MSIWKEIRKSINSTLGTKEFMPLDKLLLEKVVLVASDDVVYAVGDYRGSVDSTVIFEKTSNVTGAMRVKLKWGQYSYSKYLTVFVNGTEVAEIKYKADEPDYIDYTNFNVKKGDVIKLIMDASGSDAATNIELCGTIMQAPFAGTIFSDTGEVI